MKRIIIILIIVLTLIFIVIQLVFHHPDSKGISPVDKTPPCMRTLEQQLHWANSIYEVEIVKSEHKFDGMDFCIYQANLLNEIIGDSFIFKKSIDMVFDPLKPSAEFDFSKDCHLGDNKKIALIRNSNRKYYQICQQIILVDTKKKEQILKTITP